MLPWQPRGAEGGVGPFEGEGEDVFWHIFSFDAKADHEREQIEISCAMERRRAGAACGVGISQTQGLFFISHLFLLSFSRLGQGFDLPLLLSHSPSPSTLFWSMGRARVFCLASFFDLLPHSGPGAGHFSGRQTHSPPPSREAGHCEGIVCICI